jgi:prepilin-type N-terminal cleavage/methylation domain-containing protein
MRKGFTLIELLVIIAIIAIIVAAVIKGCSGDG